MRMCARSRSVDLVRANRAEPDRGDRVLCELLTLIFRARLDIHRRESSSGNGIPGRLETLLGRFHLPSRARIAHHRPPPPRVNALYTFSRTPLANYAYRRSRGRILSARKNRITGKARAGNARSFVRFHRRAFTLLHIGCRSVGVFSEIRCNPCIVYGETGKVRSEI